MKLVDLMNEVVMQRKQAEQAKEDESLDLADMRIVENVDPDLLESMDDDGEILGVPLLLDEACVFDFGKHIDAILNEQQEAEEEHHRMHGENVNQVERDRRYKEMPRDLIRVGDK